MLAFKLSLLPCVLAQQKLIFRQKHLFRLEAYNFVIKPSCEAKVYRIAVDWLQIYFMQEKIPDFILGKNDPSRKWTLVHTPGNTFFDHLT